MPFKITKGDIRNEGELDNLFNQSIKEGKPIKAVLHFAGLKSVRESVLNLEYWDVNVNGSINLLKVMDKYDCKTIVFSSSATVYGLSENGLLHEESEINPPNPYGRTKITVENLLNDLYKKSPNKWRMQI